MVVLAPIVARLLAVTQPLVRVIFGRGEFDAGAVQLTSTAISWFALALVGIAVAEVSSRAFYALGDSRTPVTLAVLGMVVNVGGDLLLGRTFGVAGIAAATTASFLVVATGQVLALHVRHRAVDLPAVGARTLRCSVAAAVGGGAGWSVTTVLPASTGGSSGRTLRCWP